MKKRIFSILFLGLSLSLSAQKAQLSGAKFKNNKELVAEVDEFKLGFLQGREKRLVNAKQETLIVCKTKEALLDGKQFYYVSLELPSTNDSIQFSLDQFAVEVDGSLMVGSLKEFAIFFDKYEVVNIDGTLNQENLNKIKSKYGNTAVATEIEKRAKVAKCTAEINKPVSHQPNSKITVKETSRLVEGGLTTINYSIELDGMAIATVVAVGDTSMVANERAEVDFKTKFIYKKSDIMPMSYTINKMSGCLLASYKASEKKLYTERKDKGGWHGIMKPILNDKVETVQKRTEVIEAMAKYLIDLTYL